MARPYMSRTAQVTPTGARTFTVPQNVSWGLIFGGRANFNVIVQELKAKHGMSAATHVMLTGASAGGMGALWNVDFLAQQLPRA
jgi:lipid-binding SYLF domain-containing protein